MSADEEVDDSFISIRVKNIGVKRNVFLTSRELGGIPQEINLGL